jgi:hypothetical protein
MRVFARLLKRTCLSTMLLGSIGAAAAIVPATASAAPTTSRVVGHVYVNDDTAGTNTIGAFDRHADGSLTPEAGSPFNAGGAGNGGGLASQGAIQITGNGRHVLAVDAGSNQISVLKVNFDGSLSLQSVTSSRGQLPVSVAVHHHLVYVANASPTSPNYTGFTLHHGQLTPLAHSTIALADGAQPADVLFNDNGQKLAATEAGSGEIDSFRSRPRESVRLAASSAPPTRTSCSSQTPITTSRPEPPAMARSRRSTTHQTASWRRSEPPHSPISRPHRAGSRSRTTGGSCSP